MCFDAFLWKAWTYHSADYDQAQFFSDVASAEMSHNNRQGIPDIWHLWNIVSFGCGVVVEGSLVVMKLVIWELVSDHSATVIHGSVNIQLNVSNTHWIVTDSVVLWKDILDFSGQHMFTYSGVSAMPDIIQHMQQCTIAWRPLLDCQNANCQCGSQEEDKVNNTW